MTLQTDNQPEQPHSRHGRSHSRRRKKSHKPSFLSKIISGFQKIGGFFSGSKGSKHRKSTHPPLTERLKYRWEEFKAEFALPERYNRSSQKHQSLWKRIKYRLKEDVQDILPPESIREKIPKPKFSIRARQKLDDVKDDLTFKRLFPKVGARLPW